MFKFRVFIYTCNIDYLQQLSKRTLCLNDSKYLLNREIKWYSFCRIWTPNTEHLSLYLELLTNISIIYLVLDETGHLCPTRWWSSYTRSYTSHNNELNVSYSGFNLFISSLSHNNSKFVNTPIFYNITAFCGRNSELIHKVANKK